MPNFNDNRPSPFQRATPARIVPLAQIAGAYAYKHLRNDVRLDKRRGNWPLEVATAMLWLEAGCFPVVDVAGIAVDEEVIMDLWP